MIPKARWIPVVLLCLGLVTPALADRSLPELQVSCQGLFRQASAPGEVLSPSGLYRLQVQPVRGDFHHIVADLLLTGPDGGSRRIAGVEGNGFMMTDTGRIVVIDADHSSPSGLRILDLDGRTVGSWSIDVLTDPVLARDSSALAFRHAEGVSLLDLATFSRQNHPQLSRFVPGPGSLLAGVRPEHPYEVLIYRGGTVVARLAVTSFPRRLGFDPDGNHLFVLLEDRLLRFATDDPLADPVNLFTAPRGTELRDLQVHPDRLAIGLRRIEAGRFSGERLDLDHEGLVIGRLPGPSRPVPVAPESLRADPSPQRTHEPISWPLEPNSQHPIGNTYGEYQNYGSSYLHPGVDLMGNPGQTVVAVKAGQVKAVLTTSGEYHWRVAIGEEGSGTSEGYLYAHLEENSIAVEVGDLVTQGQYLGDLVDWPVADFTHIHFARIQDTGTTWSGSWLCTDNPHLDFPNLTENQWPIFEPAVGSDMFAFCSNETSNYQDPDALQGMVDIVAHVGDRLNHDWVCTVQEIRLSIYSAANPDHLIVDNLLAVNFDMMLDTYIGGPIDPFLVDLLYKQDSTCRTEGDYEDREFYHIVTNSNGDEVYEEADRWQAWDTTELPDTDYVVRVEARDAAGNAAVATMQVTTANGNPTSVAAGAFQPLSLSCSPNPSSGGSVMSFRLGRATPARLAVYDLSGRLLRTVWSGDLPTGPHALVWDGADDAGRNLAAGTYLIRLETDTESRTEKLILLR